VADGINTAVHPMKAPSLAATVSRPFVNPDSIEL